MKLKFPALLVGTIVGGLVCSCSSDLVQESSCSGGSSGNSASGAAGAADVGGQGDEPSEGGAAGEGGSFSDGTAGTGESGAAGTSCIAATGAGGGGSTVLYTNDFEHPNVPLEVNCGNSLDNRGINALYGSPGFTFAQTYTVEGVVIHDPSALYSDPSGKGKNYAIGMLSALQDDHLALTFGVTGDLYLNVGFDLSSIDVQACGGPVGVTAPIMHVMLYDTPTGTFNLAAPGTLLDDGDVVGVRSGSPWTFEWHYGLVALDATRASGSSVTVVFDLLQSGYAAFDNLSIVSSNAANVVDRNNNGVPDDEECR